MKKDYWKLRTNLGKIWFMQGTIRIFFPARRACLQFLPGSTWQIWNGTLCFSHERGMVSIWRPSHLADNQASLVLGVTQRQLWTAMKLSIDTDAPDVKHA